ncbi:hypothetical protein [Sporocytophaga myxococcoides]|uniref:hypothetical protein n=1 Tax=Sporocytophaga myxococcoides TaxID=153721 RepID=UPI0004118AD0|nr:hypothetical protein [Sporocytophaga myxococcoides]
MLQRIRNIPTDSPKSLFTFLALMNKVYPDITPSIPQGNIEIRNNAQKSISVCLK